MILRSIFCNQACGFYIDIGACHPRRFSNTYFFYQQGWSGINIDATPGQMKTFHKERPRDENLEIAIGRQNEYLTFFVFNEPALNTFDKELAYSRMSKKYYVIQEHSILTQPLVQILNAHLPEGQIIDFMSIDVEGLDLAVLQSNNWQCYRPRYLLVESLDFDLERPGDDATHAYVTSLHYKLIARTPRTLLYQNIDEHTRMD